MAILIKRLIFVLFMLFFLVNVSIGQWSHLNGPYRGQISAFFVKDSLVFAGTTNSGVYRSFDKGENWTISGLPNKFILAFAQKGDDLFISTFSSEIYRSIDNGKNWALVNNQVPGSHILSLAASDDIIFAGTFNGFFRSLDNGMSWISSGLENEVINQISIKGDNIFVATNTSIFISSDKGVTWNLTALTNLNIKSLSVFDDFIFVGSDGAFYRSVDNGDTWSVVGSGVTQTIQCVSMIDDVLFVGTSGDGVMISNNNGDTFSDSGLFGNSIASLVVSESTLFAGSGTGIFKTTDLGTSWNEANTGLTNQEILSLVTKGDTILAGSRESGIFLSIDNGDYWRHLISKVPSQPYLDFAAKALCISGNNFVAGLVNYGIYISSDEGVTWEAKLPDVDVGCFLTNDDAIFAGTNGGIFKSMDNGQTWNAIGLTDQDIRSLTLTQGVLYAGTNENGVFRSTDNGVSWDSKNSGLTNLNIPSLISNGDVLYAGTLGSGIFISRNLGETWSSASGGIFGDLTINSLNVSKETVLAGTLNGVFVTSNDALSWKEFGTGLPILRVNSISSNDVDIFIGTNNSILKKSFLTLEEVVPSRGVAGYSIILKGEYFSPVLAENMVRFNGALASVVAASPTEVTVILPSDATTGLVTITVNGQTVISANEFTAIPTIINVSPTSGAAGDLITISGTSFSDVKSNDIVKFNGVSATIVAATSTQLTVNIPDEATTGFIAVTVQGQAVNSSDNFMIIPTVKNISPIYGSAGDSITISGTSFSKLKSDDIVKINEVLVTVVSATSTQLVIMLPDEATTGPVTLTVNGQTIHILDRFVVVPKITGLSPLSGSIGSQVKISGISFSNTIEEDIVKFNGILATVISATPKEIIVKVPERATTGIVTVTVAGQTVISQDEFSVELVTGVVEEDGGSGIYPNPFQKILYFNYQNKVEVSIQDGSGRNVFNKLSVEKELDLSFLSKGFYIMKIFDQGTNKIFKVIKSD